MSKALEIPIITSDGGATGLVVRRPDPGKPEVVIDGTFDGGTVFDEDSAIALALGLLKACEIAIAFPGRSRIKQESE